jgi:hypothetical protein
MRSYDRDYFIVMASFATGLLPSEGSDLTKTAQASITATNDFMQRHELELPPSIRELMKELAGAIKWQDSDFPAKRPGPNDVLKMARAVSDATNNVRTDIERLIG